MGGREPRHFDDGDRVTGHGMVGAVSDSAVPTSAASDSDPIITIEIRPNSAAAVTPPELKGTGLVEPANGQPMLSPGVVLGQRYEILEILGHGGMGAVYKARDREVNHVIALKVIRPDLAGDARILERFKQELVLSHQVTHKNVIRIYDLGDADGLKFITMEYIQGTDLRSLILERKSFPPQESAEIMLQICRALEATHAVGIIHRDLKPQNIMRDSQGRIVIMDFGLARSIESHGMTQTGALVGTMEYMSPEQALGRALDQRSDLFAAGLMFYELLTGKMPFAADSALASLIKRTQECAIPVNHHDRNIPPLLTNIVGKCLERDPKLRYQSSEEIMVDLDAFLGKAPAASVVAGFAEGVRTKTNRLYWAGAAVALVLCALAGGMYFFRGRPAVVPRRAVSLLVGDFANQTGDAVFDGTVEPAFSLALEGASFISSYSRTQAHTVGQQLKPGAGALDESLARLVAVREGVSIVLTGSVLASGTGFRVQAKAIDAVTGKTLASAAADADHKKDVLRAVDKVAAHMRVALGDTTPESVQLAKIETYSSGSLEAAHEYAIAQSLRAAGKFQGSISHYSRAIELDRDMGRAYAGRAASLANMGHTQEALKDYQAAMMRIDRMTDREKYRTRGGYYLLEREPQKAIEEFSALVKQFPSDDAGYFNLALAYAFLHDMGKALEEGRHAVEIAPHVVLGRMNVALYAVYAGEFETGIKEVRTIEQLDPTNTYIYRALAMANVGEGKMADATDTYNKLTTLGPENASMASLGRADIALYMGRATEAIPILDEGISADMVQKDNASAATKWVALGYAYYLSGRNAQAVAAANRAIALDKETNVLFSAGGVLVEAGQLANALSLASRLSARIEPDPQLYGKLLEGEVRLKRGETKNAIALFQGAQKSADTWLGHFDLGRAYLDAGLFTEADSEFETCLRRRGEAAALFFDELPTFRLLPPVYYYLGRAQEGLKSPAARDSYRKFIAIQEQGTGPLLTDAHRRLTLN